MNHPPVWPVVLLTAVLAAMLANPSGAKEPTSSTTNALSAQTTMPTTPALRVREPAVAGLFYPKDPSTLSQLLDTLLAAVPKQRVGQLKALICPHAGYRYSGQTAAFSYQAIAGHDFQKVILLAPSHYARFSGASVSAADVFQTPLGRVPIWEKTQDLARQPPFVREAPCPVQRPTWAPRAARRDHEDTPHTWEHADEVQVPFLQKMLPHFRLLPILMGEVDPEAVARGLEPLLDAGTLLVASSDLSHYHPYDQAKELDARCVAAITNLDLAQMRDAEACGQSPILALLHLAKWHGWHARLLDYRNSGDATGDKSGGVVGYAAVAFFAPEPAAGAPVEGYSKAEKKFLLDLARQSVRAAVATGQLPAVPASSVPQRLTETKGCFVTLTQHGRLRGCIGHILPQEPLYRAVMDNARSAALHDSRFPRVAPAELDELQFEISVLTEPKPLAFTSPEDLLSKLRPHQDGVVLKIGGRSATFLPQVWEQVPDKVQFLDHLAAKSGHAPSDWREPGTIVSTYQVEAFTDQNL